MCTCWSFGPFGMEHQTPPRSVLESCLEWKEEGIDAGRYVDALCARGDGWKVKEEGGG